MALDPTQVIELSAVVSTAATVVIAFLSYGAIGTLLLERKRDRRRAFTIVVRLSDTASAVANSLAVIVGLRELDPQAQGTLRRFIDDLLRSLGDWMGRLRDIMNDGQIPRADMLARVVAASLELSTAELLLKALAADALPNGQARTRHVDDAVAHLERAEILIRRAGKAAPKRYRVPGWPWRRRDFDELLNAAYIDAQNPQFSLGLSLPENPAGQK